MRYKKIATHTDDAGYRPVYFDEKEDKICEYPEKNFKSKTEVLDYLAKKPEATKGYVTFSFTRRVYFPENSPI